jgi:hypothetical protein
MTSHDGHRTVDMLTAARQAKEKITALVIKADEQVRDTRGITFPLNDWLATISDWFATVSAIGLQLYLLTMLTMLKESNNPNFLLYSF